jgi:hypothetical protein
MDPLIVAAHRSFVDDAGEGKNAHYRIQGSNQSQGQATVVHWLCNFLIA